MDSLILIIFVLLFDGVKSPSCQAFQNRYLLLLRRRMRHQDQKSTRCLMDKDDQVRTLFLQSSGKRLVHGLVKFVPALACLFCLALLGTCLVESAYLISEPCI